MIVGDTLAPFSLKPVFAPRVWGRRSLQPWYASTGMIEAVGEAWLTGPACVIGSGPLAGKAFGEIVREHAAELLSETASEPEFPLLVKMLFPNDKLSVQVHPDDSHAHALGIARGKTECWYVIEAKPGATVALGLLAGVTREHVAEAIAGGTLESLLNFVPVTSGDMVYVDAGTVHAIGPGVTLLEVQQTCDVTYRLFDYGRPRELHLEDGLRVLKTETAAGKIEAKRVGGYTQLIAQRYFTVDRFDLDATGPGTPGSLLRSEVQFSMACPTCLVGLAGHATVLSRGAEIVLSPGHAIVVPIGSDVVVETGGEASFVRCSAPVNEPVNGPVS